MQDLVSAQWLNDHLGEPGLMILEAGLAAPVLGASKGEGCIEGSVYCNLDTHFCDHNAPFPHMMAGPGQLSRDLQMLGLRRDDCVVIYDRQGIYAAARLWMALRTVGHRRLAILDGGLPAWRERGFATAPVHADPTAGGDFVLQGHDKVFCDIADVQKALLDDSFAVIDARSQARFHGLAAEPRTGLRAGHMPNAFNLPFASVLNDGFLKPVDEIRNIFEAVIGKRRRLVFTCGSGVTACILAFAAHRAGYTDTTIYDGSWCEWGSRADLPVTTA